MPLSIPRFLKKDALAMALFMLAMGSMCAFAMPPYGLFLLLVPGLSSLYWALSRVTKPWHAFWLGYVFSLGFFTFGLYWIGNALLVDGNIYRWAWPLAVSGLPLGLSFFNAFACYALKRFVNLRSLNGLFAFTGALALSEWLRGNLFTGFPWNLFATTWGYTLEMVQIVCMADIYLLSTLTIFWASCAGWLIITESSRINKAFVCTLVFLSIAGTYTYGYVRLRQNPIQLVKNQNIVVVQPDIKQSEKWKSDKILFNFQEIIKTSNPDDMKENGIQNTTIVWPETSLSPFLLSRGWVHNMIADMLQKYGENASLLTGALRYDPHNKTYHNSIINIGNNGDSLDFYDKNHLVPFGEYMPLKDILDISPIVGFEGFAKGEGYTIKQTQQGLRYFPLICYEIIFPGTLPHDKKAPDIIINVSNDAWYGMSAGPYQHYIQAVFRAVETGVPIARSANTGISGIIDGNGRTIKKISLGVRGAISSPVPKKISIMNKNPYLIGLSYLLLWMFPFLMTFSVRIFSKYSRNN